MYQIAKHNRNYKSNKLHFNCSVNEFTDMTTQEFASKFTGLKLGANNIKQSKNHHSNESTRNPETSFQKSVDWRGISVTAVRQQVI